MPRTLHRSGGAKIFVDKANKETQENENSRPAHKSVHNQRKSNTPFKKRAKRQFLKPTNNKILKRKGSDLVQEH